MKRKTVLLRELNRAKSVTLFSTATLVKRLSIGLLVLATSATLSGCGTVGNLFSAEEATEQAAVAGAPKSDDITLPPIIPRAESDKVVETSPDETISFDEWRKQREADAKSDAE